MGAKWINKAFPYANYLLKPQAAESITYESPGRASEGGRGEKKQQNKLQNERHFVTFSLMEI